MVPRNIANTLDQVEPYGFFILIGLMVTGILGEILMPFIAPTFNFIYSIFA